MSKIGAVTSRKNNTYSVSRRSSDGDVAIWTSGGWRSLGIKVRSDAEALVVAKKYVDGSGY